MVVFLKSFKSCGQIFRQSSYLECYFLDIMVTSYYIEASSSKLQQQKVIIRQNYSLLSERWQIQTIGGCQSGSAGYFNTVGPIEKVRQAIISLRWYGCSHAG